MIIILPYLIKESNFGEYENLIFAFYIVFRLFKIKRIL